MDGVAAAAAAAYQSNTQMRLLWQNSIIESKIYPTPGLLRFVTELCNGGSSKGGRGATEELHEVEEHTNWSSVCCVAASQN